MTELKKLLKVNDFCNRREFYLLGENRGDVIKMIHQVWYLWLHLFCRRLKNTGDIGACPRCISPVAQGEKPRALAFLLPWLLSFCHRVLSLWEAPQCVLTRDRPPRATWQLCVVNCLSTPWLECVGVADRVLFHRTLIFILQVSYLEWDENKSLAVCVSLHYVLSALPPPPSLLPVLWKSGSEQLTARLEPTQICTFSSGFSWFCSN